jgi:hypothetical protein
MQKSFPLIAVVLTASLTLVAQQPGDPRGRGFGGPGRGGRGPGMRQDRPVTGAPYAATRVSTSQQTLANGTVINRQEQSQIYRDGQGRMRTETTPEAGSQRTGSRNSAPRIAITDPVAGVFRELDVQNKTSFETPMPRRGNFSGNPGANQNPRPNQTGRANPPSNPNLKEESLGTQFMNGVNATGSRITRTIPAGTIGNSQTIQTVEERWVSEDLKVPVMVKFTDPRSGTRTETLNVTSRAEPDPSLFQAPVGFTVKTRPSGPGGRRGPRPAAPAQPGAAAQ